MYPKAACLLMAISLLGGCAVRPIPDDTTKYSTVQIVRKVRCETRETVRKKLMALLNYRYSDETDTEFFASKRISEEVGKRAPPKKIAYDGLSSRKRGYITKYAGTAVAYSFNFNMTNTQNNSASLGFLDTLSRGKVTYGFGAGLDRSRNNSRTLAVVDKFGKLYGEMQEDYCTDRNQVSNYIYPIAGNIGMDEMVNTFVDLNEFDGLTGKESGSAPTLGDTIQFTTKVSGSASPALVIEPVLNGFASAGITSTASREDKHQVVIGLSLPVDGAGAEKVKDFLGEFVTGQGDATELRALNVVEQQKRENAVSRVQIVN